MNTNKELTVFSTQEERHETYFGKTIQHQDQVNIRLGKHIDHSLLNFKKGLGHVNFKMVKNSGDHLLESWGIHSILTYIN